MDGATTGATLRRARHLAGRDERSTARALGIGARRLRSIEAGRAAADPELIDLAVRELRDDLDLPARADLERPSEPGLLVVGAERIPIALAAEGNRVLLARYVGAVRAQRGLEDDEPVEFRAADLVALARVLDLTADGLDRELSSLTGLDDAAARRAARLLVLTGLSVMALGGTSPAARTWISGPSPFTVSPHPGVVVRDDRPARPSPFSTDAVTGRPGGAASPTVLFTLRPPHRTASAPVAVGIDGVPVRERPATTFSTTPSVRPTAEPTGLAAPTPLALAAPPEIATGPASTDARPDGDGPP